MSILLKPLQQILWSPLQPYFVSLSDAVSFVGQAVGQFSNDFNFDFDRLNFTEFNSDFSDDFAITSHLNNFNNDFNIDFAQA